MQKGIRIITILSLLVIAVMIVAACGGGCAFCVTAFLSQSRAQVQKRKERCRQYEPEYERR